MVWTLRDPYSRSLYCTAQGFNISIFHCKSPIASSKNKKCGSVRSPHTVFFFLKYPYPVSIRVGQGCQPGKIRGAVRSTGLLSQLIQHLQDMLSFQDQISQAVIADSFFKPVIESELFTGNGGFKIFEFDIGKGFQLFANFI